MVRNDEFRNSENSGISLRTHFDDVVKRCNGMCEVYIWWERKIYRNFEIELDLLERREQ